MASSPALHETAGLLDLVAVLLLTVGLVGVIRLLRGPRGAVGRVGSGLLVVAVIVLEAGTFSVSLLEAAGVGPGFFRSQTLAWEVAANSGPFTVVFPVAFFGGFILGSVLLAVGLIRRRVVPIRAAILVIAQAVLSFVAPDNLTDALADLVLAVGFGAVAWSILSLSNEQWAAWQPLPDPAVGGERPDPQPSDTPGSALA